MKDKILINIYHFLWKITNSIYFANKVVNITVRQVRKERRYK